VVQYSAKLRRGKEGGGNEELQEGQSYRTARGGRQAGNRNGGERGGTNQKKEKNRKNALQGYQKKVKKANRPTTPQNCYSRGGEGLN